MKFSKECIFLYQIQREEKGSKCDYINVGAIDINPLTLKTPCSTLYWTKMNDAIYFTFIEYYYYYYWEVYASPLENSVIFKVTHSYLACLIRIQVMVNFFEGFLTDCTFNFCGTSVFFPSVHLPERLLGFVTLVESSDNSHYSKHTHLRCNLVQIQHMP